MWIRLFILQVGFASMFTFEIGAQSVEEKIKELSTAQLLERHSLFSERVSTLKNLEAEFKNFLNPSIPAYQGGSSAELSHEFENFKQASESLKSEILVSPAFEKNSESSKKFQEALRVVDLRTGESFLKLMKSHPHSKEFLRARIEFDISTDAAMSLSQIVLEGREGGDPLFRLEGKQLQELPEDLRPSFESRKLVDVSNPLRKRFLELMIARAASLEKIRDQVLGPVQFLTNDLDQESFDALTDEAIADAGWGMPVFWSGLLIGVTVGTRPCIKLIKRIGQKKFDKISPKIKTSLKWGIRGFVGWQAISTAIMAKKIAERATAVPELSAPGVDELTRQIIAFHSQPYETSAPLLAWGVQNRQNSSTAALYQFRQQFDLDTIQSRWGSLSNALQKNSETLNLIENELKLRK